MGNKATVKIKEYLIKNLGGYTFPEYAARQVPVIKTEQHPVVTIAAKHEYNPLMYHTDNDLTEHILTQQICESLREKGLIEFSKDNAFDGWGVPIVTTQARVRVIDPRREK